MDFDNIAFINTQIVEDAYQKGLIAGKDRVDNNIYNNGYQQGFNIGQLIGVIQGECKILKLLGKDNEKIQQQIINIENKLKELQLKEQNIAVQLIQLKGKLHIIKRQLNIKGGMEFKREQNIDF